MLFRSGMFGLIWGISAAVAALAGVLLAPAAFVHVNMGYIGLKAFPAAVLGGFGSLPGAVVGGLIIGVDHTFVYTGAVRKMRELVENGSLGDIYYYDSVRVKAFDPTLSVLDGKIWNTRRYGGLMPQGGPQLPLDEPRQAAFAGAPYRLATARVASTGSESRTAG